jgi:hypothetical protein
MGRRREFWYPGAIRTNSDGHHRDTLFGVGFRRSWGTRAVRPHVLFGLSVGRTVDELTTCVAIRQTSFSPNPMRVHVSCSDPDVVERRPERFSGTSLFPLVGAGAEIRLNEHLRLIPDVRVQLWLTSMIVRPAIAVGVAF